MSAAGEVAAFSIVLIIGGTMVALWYAYQREDSGDFEYALSYWLGGLPGMFAYREYRANNPDMPDVVRRCPDCGATHTDAPSFCGDCGTELDDSHDHPAVAAKRAGRIVFCGHCDAELGTEAGQCDRCGSVLL